MGNLVITPPGFGSIINWVALAANVANLNTLRSLLGPYRPPQWAQQQLYSITVTQVTTTTTSSNILFGTSNANIGNLGGAAVPQAARQTSGTPVTYFFDAVMRAEHSQELTATRHPIQLGAAVVDHAYMQPPRVTLEIMMSDSLGKLDPLHYTSNTSKSISAFQTFLSIQQQRLPLTLNTRINSYPNMLIERIAAVEDSRTKFVLKAQITFMQIIVANLATATVPARSDQTQTTNEGTKVPLTPNTPTANLLGTFPLGGW